MCLIFVKIQRGAQRASCYKQSVTTGNAEMGKNLFISVHVLLLSIITLYAGNLIV